MLEKGQIVHIYLPKDKVIQIYQDYGCVKFIHKDEAEYISKIINKMRLYKKQIWVNKVFTNNKKTIKVYVELIIKNLDSIMSE